MTTRLIVVIIFKYYGNIDSLCCVPGNYIVLSVKLYFKNNLLEKSWINGYQRLGWKGRVGLDEGGGQKRYKLPFIG